MPELARDAAAQNIREAPMSVSRHRDQVTVFALRARGNLVGGITSCENCFGGVSLSLERLRDPFDVLAVAFNLHRLA
jgi:hypothetical protein